MPDPFDPMNPFSPNPGEREPLAMRIVRTSIGVAIILLAIVISPIVVVPLYLHTKVQQWRGKAPRGPR